MPALRALSCSFAGLLLAGGVADAAQWPAGVLGIWSGQSNQTAVGVAITTQGTGHPCAIIAGTMGDGQTTGEQIQGFYCPLTGRIGFERIWGGSVDLACQIYSGNVSAVGATLSISGGFAVINGCGGPLGDYNFQLHK